MPYLHKPWRNTCEIPPGEFVVDYCEDRNIPLEQLPARFGMSPEDVDDFLIGKTDVTPELAHKIADLLDSFPEKWLWFQKNYEDTIARNAAMERDGINTTVYKMVDDDGQPVMYGMTTDTWVAWEENEQAGFGTKLKPLTWFLHPDVAARKLAKLQRAFRNRKQRQAAETAAANAQAAA